MSCMEKYVEQTCVSDKDPSGSESFPGTHPRAELPLYERVLARAVRAENGCLEWQGASGGGGYGRIKYRGELHSPHRVVLEALVGPLPPGMIACHTCDNRRCVDPAHLFAGSYSDNNIDAIRKGRMKKPPANGPAVAASNRRRRLGGYKGERREMSDKQDTALALATRSERTRAPRKRRMVEWDGEVMIAAELARRVGLSTSEIVNLANRGWFALPVNGESK